MRIEKALFLVASLVMSWGCSGSAETVKSDSSSGDTAPAVTRVETSANAAAETPAPNNLAIRPYGRKRVVLPDTEPLPRLQFREGAEDSEIATSMNSNGEIVETRIFRNHPQLGRVEAVWKSAKEATLKISLKGGKTIDVKSDRLVNLHSATTRDLIEIAGIRTGRGAGKKPG